MKFFIPLYQLLQIETLYNKLNPCLSLPPTVFPRKFDWIKDLYKKLSGSEFFGRESFEN